MDKSKIKHIKTSPFQILEHDPLMLSLNHKGTEQVTLMRLNLQKNTRELLKKSPQKTLPSN